MKKVLEAHEEFFMCAALCRVPGKKPFGRPVSPAILAGGLVTPGFLLCPVSRKLGETLLALSESVMDSRSVGR